MFKNLMEKIKELWLAYLICMCVGYCIGKLYAYDEIIKDCKVLGMTRYGNLPIGCRVGEKYQ